jgi:hypothetical protein
MIELVSTGIAKLVQLFTLFIEDNAELRMRQATNAPQCLFEGVGTVIATGFTQIDQAQTSGQLFSSLRITFTPAAQTGFWSLSGAAPRADGTFGVPIAAGGAVLDISGSTNIRNFKMIAATGNTMPFSFQLFR